MGHGHAKLAKADMDFLLKNTNFDKNTIREWYDAFMIDCPTGELTPEKLAQIYSTFYPNGNATEFSRHTFRTFDTDHSGLVDFREFLLAISMVSNGTPEQKLDWAFHLADIDGNGTIEREEIRTIVKATITMTGTDEVRQNYDIDAKVSEIFDRLDINKDGVLSKEEYIKGCLADPALSELLAPSPAFKELTAGE